MKRALLFVVGVVALLLLVKWADLDSVRSALVLVNPMTLLLLCFLQIVTIALITTKWTLLAGSLGCPVPWWKMLWANMVGSFVEGVTPSVKAGGEVAKVVVLTTRLGFPAPKAIALVGVQKIISIVPFLLLCVASILWLLLTSQAVELTSVLTVALVALCLVMGFTIKLLVSPLSATSSLRKFRLFAKYAGKLEGSWQTIASNVRLLLTRREAMLMPVLLSWLIWILFGVKAYILARAMQVEVGFVLMAVATYLSYMVAMVPLLPGGMGSFEASMVLILAAVGVVHAEALALSIVLRAITFWFVLLLSGLVIGLGSVSKDLRHKR